MFYKGSAISGNGGGSGNVDWGDIGGSLSDQTDLQDALNGKAGTSAFTGATALADGAAGLVPAPTTSDVGKFLSADGTWATAGVDIDESTIIENAQNKLQAVGVVNANTASGATTPLKLWEGTEAEWNVGGGTKDTYYNWLHGISASVSSIASANWYSCAYGNGKYVAIARDSTSAMYSSDGDSWTASTLPSSGGWISVAYGNNTFVTVDRNSKAAYSTDDGETWTAVTDMDSGYGWWAVAYGDGKFVTVGIFQGKAAYSSNGINWTTVDMPVSKQYKSIAYGDGVFIALADNGGARTTDNGLTWSTVNVAGTSITYGDGKFVCVSSSSIYYSTDKGVTWTQVRHTYLLNYVAYGNGMFVAVKTDGSIVAYSKDAINWIQTNITVGSNVQSISYGTDGRFIVCCQTNGVYTLDISDCYTTDAEPTTASTVYSAPEVTSALTITAVDTGTITLSDTNTYTYNAGGNAYSYYSVGETYPTWLCFIEGVGVKIGTTVIAQVNGTVDQTYDATSTNAISGVGVAQALARPTE